MADARDRRNGIRRVRLVMAADEHRAFRRQVRDLQVALGTDGLEATLLEAVRRQVELAGVAAPSADPSRPAAQDAAVSE